MQPSAGFTIPSQVFATPSVRDRYAGHSLLILNFFEATFRSETTNSLCGALLDPEAADS
jgi:hypothetical protein